MALTADRWLNVTPAADSRKMRVAVFGVTYDESSAHREAKKGLALSLVDPLTGHVEDLTPAKVADRTIVEVWVERLDARWGEDFGWQRVSDVIITQRIPAPTGTTSHTTVGIESIFGRPLSVERVESTAPIQEHDAISLTPSHVIDFIHAWQTLWEGDVTLPDALLDGTRHRLVVAEYEEYLVDDSRPYDKTPTSAKRRLVFVDHIEIS